MKNRKNTKMEMMMREFYDYFCEMTMKRRIFLGMK